MLIEKLLSVYRMYYEQAEAAGRKTANELFDRKKYGTWKYYIVMFLWMLTHYLNERMLEVTQSCLKL